MTGDFKWLKTCELKTKIEWKTIKNYQIFYAIKKFCFLFCICEMYLISAKGYKNAGVWLFIEKETGIIWVSIKNVQYGLGVQNISDLVLKEIYVICKTKNPTKDQIKKYKMMETEIFKKYANLVKMN